MAQVIQTEVKIIKRWKPGNSSVRINYSKYNEILEKTISMIIASASYQSWIRLKAREQYLKNYGREKDLLHRLEKRQEYRDMRNKRWRNRFGRDV